MTWADFWALCTCFPSLASLELGGIHFDQPLDSTLDVKANDTASITALMIIKTLVVGVLGIKGMATVLRGLSRYPFELRLRKVSWSCTDDDPTLFDVIKLSEQSLEHLYLMVGKRVDDSFLREGDLTKHARLHTLLLGFSFRRFVAGDKPHTVIPTFLSRLHLECLRRLIIYMVLSVPRTEPMLWEFFDWPALDRSLAILAKNQPALRVTFDLSLCIREGETIPDVVGPLTDRLRNTLLAGMRIKVVAKENRPTRPLAASGMSCWLPIPHDAVE
ncbi:uncharacterized protein B0H18DRAFT_38520 [Fomitopsis serialis]|uniref:uncharacterized protein n=1 Tax=Fomitopsis serialis TaxID=139415 RepID=UPI0020084A84|nr:uncharacterized protein B0H18DRAFT_38520 [Neoantrodia serialis]KAH9917324.1 hypothetical protein B0H18DRAFT_38520 [Neoantrodia serialis]